MLQLLQDNKKQAHALLLNMFIKDIFKYIGQLLLGWESELIIYGFFTSLRRSTLRLRAPMKQAILKFSDWHLNVHFFAFVLTF